MGAVLDVDAIYISDEVESQEARTKERSKRRSRRLFLLHFVKNVGPYNVRLKR